MAVIAYAARPDVLGPLPQLLEHGEVIKKFYGYTNIVPWEDL